MEDEIDIPGPSAVPVVPLVPPLNTKKRRGHQDHTRALATNSSPSLAPRTFAAAEEKWLLATYGHMAYHDLQVVADAHFGKFPHYTKLSTVQVSLFSLNAPNIMFIHKWRIPFAVVLGPLTSDWFPMG
jgi:hypothetical protein